MPKDIAEDGTQKTKQQWAGSVKTNKFQGLAKIAWNFDKNNGVYGSINYLNDQLDTYKYSPTEARRLPTRII